jgi:hypothetical protein
MLLGTGHNLARNCQPRKRERFLACRGNPRRNKPSEAPRRSARDHTIPLSEHRHRLLRSTCFLPSRNHQGSPQGGICGINFFSPLVLLQCSVVLPRNIENIARCVIDHGRDRFKRLCHLYLTNGFIKAFLACKIPAQIQVGICCTGCHGKRGSGRSDKGAMRTWVETWVGQSGRWNGKLWTLFELGA